MAEIVLRGDNICKMLIEVRIKNKDFLLPKNISILNFLLKCKVSYLYAFNQDLNDVINYTDMILIPSEEDYNNLIYKTLEKKFINRRRGCFNNNKYIKYRRRFFLF